MSDSLNDPFRTRLASALGPSVTLEDELGGGGMSRVFLARDTRLDRRIVVKALPEDATGTVSLERFRREISVAAGITHPHVVPLLAAGDAGGVPYYTMPFVDGETLRARLMRGKVPVDEAVGILRDIAKGLSAAHARGVVHRDIKPENVLLVAGTAMVTDFGVSKAVSAATGGDKVRGGITAPGLAVGTPAYMAPEQIAGDPLMDHRVDLYAWGVVAYELLAGEHPFAGRTPGDLLAAQLTLTAPPLATRAPLAPRGLVALVERAMQKSPASRPSSATELVSMLGHLRVEAATAAAAPAASDDGPRARLRRRVPDPAPTADAASVASSAVTPPRVPWRSVFGTVAVIVGLAAGFKFLQRDVGTSAVDARVVAVAPFRTGGAPAVAYLREGMMDLLSPALGGVAGTRALDVRSFLAALRREPAGSEPDLEALLRTARTLGAAQLIDGSITGTPDRLAMRAVLYQTRDGAEVTAATVEGPADSVPALVARLAATLLAVRAGEIESRTALLLGRDPDAVRRYLDGLVAYRAGDYDRAVAAFDAALDRDSAFAMAALRGAQASGWSFVAPARARLATAWRRRDRLAADDSALVEAMAGAAYPSPTPAADLLAAAERFAARRPENADAQLLYADRLFHSGAMVDAPDWIARSIEHFSKAIALDSTLQPAREHLSTLYLMAGRVNDARAVLGSLVRNEAGEGMLGPLLRMEAASVAGDSAEFRRAVQAAMRRPPGIRGPFGAVYAVEAQGHGDASERLMWSAWDDAPRAERDALVGQALTTALVMGQAWRLWDVLRGVPNDTLRAAASLVAATLAGVEPMPATEAVRRLEPALEATLAAPGAPPGRQAFAVGDAPWALAMWAGARGDTAWLERLRTRLATRRPSSPLADARARGLLALLEIEQARAKGSADVAALARADTAMTRLPDSDGLGLRWMGLRLARAWAEAGRPADARRVIGRLLPFNGGPLAAMSWRDAARYDEATGARDEARRGWQMVRQLQLRAARGERTLLDEATRALARLGDDAPPRAPTRARPEGT